MLRAERLLWAPAIQMWIGVCVGAAGREAAVGASGPDVDWCVWGVCVGAAGYRLAVLFVGAAGRKAAVGAGGPDVD